MGELRDGKQGVVEATAGVSLERSRRTSATRRGRARRRRILGLTPRRFAGVVVVPVASSIAVIVTLLLAPGPERGLLLVSSLLAVVAGLAVTSVGVYGGILVPGLLLLGVDPRFAAAASLFLQVLIIPMGAGAHYRLGNVSRSIAIPLLAGGVSGAFVGPLFAVALPSDLIARLVAALIVLVGLVVLVTMRRRGLGAVREPGDVPSRRVAGAGLVAGFSSGVSGAGWGPIGVTLLILMRIDPRAAIGSSLVGRAVMAATAVLSYLISATAFKGIAGDLWLMVPLFAGSVAAMVPGALLLSRLGRERATVLVTLLSVSLALPTLIWG